MNMFDVGRNLCKEISSYTRRLALYVQAMYDINRLERRSLDGNRRGLATGNNLYKEISFYTRRLPAMSLPCMTSK